MKKNVIFLAVLCYLSVSVFSLAEYHKDAPNGKPRECPFCIFAGTPFESAPEYVLPEQLPQYWKCVFEEKVHSSLSLTIAARSRPPPRCFA